MWQSRIAPTPSGYLHIGNAFNFLLTRALTLKHSGKLHLRIDDLDAPRVRDEYLEEIFKTLHWLGVAWQEGPTDITTHKLHYSQQLRIDSYNTIIQQLIQAGKVYACACSRKAAASGTDPCRQKNIPLAQKGTALKVNTEGAIINIKDELSGEISINLSESIGDFVIRRKDGIPAYQVASLADDIAMDINCIVRGIDLMESTAAQLFLAQIIGADSFAATRFFHHPLLTTDTGRKLSKSAGDSSLKAIREKGTPPTELLKAYEKWTQSLPF